MLILSPYSTVWVNPKCFHEEVERIFVKVK